MPKQTFRPEQTLSDILENEIKSIQACQTTIGAFHFIFPFFEKIRSFPNAKLVFSIWEKRLETLERLTFENRQKAFDWFIDKFHRIRAMTELWKDTQGQPLNEFLRLSIDRVFRFCLPMFDEDNYFKELSKIFNSILDVAVEYEKFHKELKEWVEISYKSDGKFFVSRLIFPEYVQKEISKSSSIVHVETWKEMLDVDPLTLLSFLKILALSPSYKPITSASYVTPKNLRECEQQLFQVFVGRCLGKFKKEMTANDLANLCKRFILMIEREIAPTLKGPKLKTKLSEYAEEFCIEEIVNLINCSPPEKRQEFKKWTYKSQVFNYVLHRAKETNQPFLSSISKTMVIERAGPKANRRLFKNFGIVWHPIPCKNVGVWDPLSYK